MGAAAAGFRGRVLAVLAAAVLLNLVALGLLALVGARGSGGAEFGAGVFAYLLGLRHAFDADHVAAIDNVTRRLRAAGQRPAGVGLYFSMGHSAVVLLLTAATVLAARRVGAHLPQLAAWGAMAGGVVSAGFLTLIGLANLRFLARMLRGHSAAGGGHGGFWRVMDRADRSWKMLPLGMLFGLSFDTASEVALLALSLAAAHDGRAPLVAVLLLPLLFTAGMAAMDTLESLLMLRLYDWAIADGDRTLRLNTVITGLSVALALAVALHGWIGLFDHDLRAATEWIDSASLGLLMTALLLGLGALARWCRRRQPVAAVVDARR
jgi:high-affinity nickel-transport protein